MKTIRFTAFSILLGLLVLVFACQKETNPAAATQTGSKISVTGQDAGTGLKSTLSNQTTVWIASSDQVGIYSAEARTATGGGGTPIVNAQFTAVTSAASSTFSGTMYWGAASTSHTFYAYYPYSAGSAASTVVPVSLATAQTQSAANNSAHIGALDFLVATPTTVTSPANTNAVANEVNLSYNHLFTILEFQIKGSGTLSAVKLSGSNTLAFSSGTIDITQTTPATDVAYTLASQTGPTTQAVVTLTGAATLTATNTDTKVYMVINPGTQTGNCVIGLSTDGTAWKYISKAAPGGGFLRGTKYVVSVDAATALSIGDSYQGGKIFYFLQPGDPGYVSGEIHGLIAATTDQSTGIAWWNGSYTTTGATATALGTGSANTTAIIASQGNTGSYAAKICRDYTDGLYHDWYLPSRDELNKLYLQQSAVGGFASDGYWSSSETGTNYAWIQYFIGGGNDNLIKYLGFRVRAVRAF
jgi:hypothetical protein